MGSGSYTPPSSQTLDQLLGAGRHKIDMSDGCVETLPLVNERLKLRERAVRAVIDPA